MSMKIALLGVGKIARDQHVPMIAASPDWELAATFSREGEVDGVPSYRDFAQLLAEHPDIETVSLCLPPVPRFDFAAQAIRAGRNVMLEKPPGASLSEAQTLEAMAREAGVSIYATWHSREAAMVAPAKAWLAGKRLKSMRVIWKEDVRRWHPGQAWIWQAGGLGVFDPGINALSIVTEILAEPIHVTGAELFFPENCATPIAANVAFHHPHGTVTAEMDFRQEGEQIWTIEVETDRGSLVLSEGGAKLAIGGQLQAASAALVETGDGSNPLLGGEYARLYARMAALVRAGGIDMDLSPMAHVADAFLLGRRVTVEPFIE